MNKLRLELLSDAVFAIIMTLLIIEIKVPELHGATINNFDLLGKILELGDLFMSYFLSFFILAMFWLSHHALFHFFVTNINRQLAVLNMVFLCFLCLIPFSAHLLGSYPHLQTAIVFYGLNVIAVSTMGLIMFFYALKSKEIDNGELKSRNLKQAAIRLVLTPIFAILGILISFVAPYFIAGLLFVFPIIFNIIPGGLDFLEKRLKFKLE
ncbi:MAG: TMEM175 family protein [Candidatus Altimarinota bacterium]